MSREEHASALGNWTWYRTRIATNTRDMIVVRPTDSADRKDGCEHYFFVETEAQRRDPEAWLEGFFAALGRGHYLGARDEDARDAPARQEVLP